MNLSTFKSGLRIAYIPDLVGNEGLLSPCSSIRTDYYLKLLAKEEDCYIKHIYQASSFRAELCDLLFINRLALDTENDALCLLKKLKESRKHIPLVVDLDDDLLAIPDDHVDYAYISPRVQALRLVLSHADAVITSTPELAAVLENTCRIVHVLPNRVLLSRVTSRPAQAFAQSRKVLYFGTPSHVHELDFLRPLFDPDSSSYTGLQLFVAGIVSSDSSWYRALNLLHPCVDTFIERLCHLKGFRCGLAPLRTADPLNMAKSEIKIFDYSYLGIPVIATDCPQYRRVIVDGSTGFLVSDRIDEWRACLEAIKCDQRCADISANAALHLSSIAPTPTLTLAKLKMIVSELLCRVP